MKQKILLLLYFCAYYLGIIDLFFWKNRHKILTLSYHNVIPDNLFDNSYHLGVSHSASIFESQIKILANRFKNKNKTKIQISFDDGYKNLLAIAAPILESYRFKGLFFVTGQAIQENCTLMIDKMMMWFSYVPPARYRIFDTVIGIDNQNRMRVANDLYEQLKTNYNNWDNIEIELNNAFLFDNLNISLELNKLRFIPLDKHDLNLLQQRGHSIAAHSWSHKPLSCLPVDEQKQDFAKSIQFAKEYCNSLLYSYPFGSLEEVSKETLALCELYGFTSAYLNMPETPTIFSNNKKFALPRTSLPNTKNRYLIEAKLSGFEDWCKKLIEILRKTRGLE